VAGAVNVDPSNEEIPKMKAAFKTLLSVAVVLALGLVASAEEKKGKAVTLKGELACAKCVLKADGVTKCTNAIKVKEGDKEVVYFLDDKGGKESYHKAICTSSKAGSVTGVVSEKNGQKYIKPGKDGVKYDE
jgi:hypothetical protein